MKKRPMLLAAALATALAPPLAGAVGLGQINVRSGLNEPLSAEIPILEASAEDVKSLGSRLASPEDFARVGLEAKSISVPLSFEVTSGRDGSPVIIVTSTDPVREPLLSILVEVNWANGRLLREYNVLLDPPNVAPAVIAPATRPVAPAATAAAAREPAPAPREALGSSTAAQAAPAASVPAPRPAVRPAPAAMAPTAPAPAPAATGGRVTVAEGDTLYEIALAQRPDSAIGIDQMMIAIQRENPRAFIGGNINRIRRGAELAIPERDAIARITRAEARAEVRTQNDAIRTIPAATASASATAAAATTPSAPRTTGTAANADSRLELLPPRADGEGGAGGERAGVAGGTDARATAVATDLKRAEEQLATRDQELRELRARVSELEKLDQDRRSLVTLKDSDLAQLRGQLEEREREIARLNALVAGSSAAGATAAESAPGVSAESGDATPPPADATGVPTAELPVASSDAGTTQTAPALDATVPLASTDGSTAAETAALDDAATLDASPLPPPVAGAEQAAAAPATPAVADVPPAAAIEQVVNTTPWWQKPWILSALGGLALIGLLLALFARRRRGDDAPYAATAGRVSVADAFSDDSDQMPSGSDEQRLLMHLSEYPNDLDAHLDLLRIYRVNGDVPRFETAANAMYAQVYDPAVPQWQEALALGREIAPDHPLFAEPSFLQSPSRFDESGAGSDWRTDASAPSSTWAAPTATPRWNEPAAAPLPPRVDPVDPWGDQVTPVAAPPSRFDVIEAPAAPKGRADDFDFDFAADAPSGANGATPPAGVGTTPFAEDPVGTKLDLARAYLEMGDSDGARSMLLEVVAEGHEVQRQEARRLLDELG